VSTQHTAGPWTFQHTSGGSVYQQFLIRGAGRELVALTYWDKDLMDDDQQPEANARLIAAAPAMFDTLMAILIDHNSRGCGCEVCGKVSNVLADARGLLARVRP